MNQMALKQAYARLKSLKANLPDRFHADQTYVEEFHSILDILQQESGTSLSAFRVPANEMQRESSGGNSITGETYYTGRMVCHRTYLMMRIDGVLGFFTISSPETAIGFTA
jgi:hypothetical protein